MRYGLGKFIGAKTLWFQPMLEVNNGDTFGLLSAFEWMRGKEFKKIVFTLDAKGVVYSFHSSMQDNTELESIIASRRAI